MQQWKMQYVVMDGQGGCFNSMVLIEQAGFRKAYSITKPTSKPYERSGEARSLVK